MNTTIKYNGAAGQDAFALNTNQFKTGGYFLELRLCGILLWNELFI